MKNRNWLIKLCAIMMMAVLALGVGTVAIAEEAGEVTPPATETEETAPAETATVDRSFKFDKTEMQDKAFVFYGDSLTARHGLKTNELDYIQLLRSEYGFYSYNGAVSGATWTYDSTGADKNNLFEQIKRAQYINRDADYISIMLGTNDYGWGLRSLGNPTDHPTVETEATTVYGAMRYALDLLIAANPDVKIMIMTPPLWYGKTGKNHAGEDVKGNAALNTVGYSLDDLAEVVKTVAAEYGCKLVDNAGAFTLAEADKECYQHYNNDLLHISPAGYVRLAKYIAEYGNEENA